MSRILTLFTESNWWVTCINFQILFPILLTDFSLCWILKFPYSAMLVDVICRSIGTLCPGFPCTLMVHSQTSCCFILSVSAYSYSNNKLNAFTAQFFQSKHLNNGRKYLQQRMICSPSLVASSSQSVHNHTQQVECFHCTVLSIQTFKQWKYLQQRMIRSLSTIRMASTNSGDLFGIRMYMIIIFSHR